MKRLRKTGLVSGATLSRIACRWHRLPARTAPVNLVAGPDDERRSEGILAAAARPLAAPSDGVRSFWRRQAGSLIARGAVQICEKRQDHSWGGEDD